MKSCFSKLKSAKKYLNEGKHKVKYKSGYTINTLSI